MYNPGTAKGSRLIRRNFLEADLETGFCAASSGNGVWNDR
jgi:hypothetical protein